MSSKPLVKPGQYAPPKDGKERFLFNNPKPTFGQWINFYLFNVLLGKPIEYVQYPCLGMTIVFQDLDWYVPRAELEPYLLHILSYYTIFDKNPVEEVKGVTLMYVPYKPYGRHGVTFRSKGVSQVHAQMMYDVDEWELCLNLQHRIRGDMSEEEDIKDMKQTGIFSLLRSYPGVQEHIQWRRETYGPDRLD